MKKFLASLLSILMAFSLFGCAKTPHGDSSTGSDLSGKVIALGSTTISPLLQSIAHEFENQNPKMAIDVSGTGSGEGIKACSDKTCDIGMVSRDLTSDEKSQELTEHIIAYDGVAIIVNEKNPVSNLTKEQLKGIYSGQITNWKDVGGNDANIIVGAREDGSGTREAFETSIGMEKTDMIASATKTDKTSAMIEQVKSTQNCIGYVSLGYVGSAKGIKAVDINNIEAKEENVRLKTYPIVRPLLLVTNGTLSKQTQAFLDYCMSKEAQEVVKEEHYTPIK